MRSHSKTTFGSSHLSPPVGHLRVLTVKDLPAKGINYSPSHRRRLIERKEFPEPVKLSPRKNAWWEENIDSWIQVRMSGLSWSDWIAAKADNAKVEFWIADQVAKATAQTRHEVPLCEKRLRKASATAGL